MSSSYLRSVAIHMKYVSLEKLNKSQIMVGLRSALGQYLKQVICYMDFSTHNTFSLAFLLIRKFDSWNPSSNVKPGQPEYYQKQVYNHGTRCWNGPERNVVVSFFFTHPFYLASSSILLLPFFKILELLFINAHRNYLPPKTAAVNMWY